MKTTSSDTGSSCMMEKNKNFSVSTLVSCLQRLDDDDNDKLNVSNIEEVSLAHDGNGNVKFFLIVATDNDRNRINLKLNI